MLGNLKKLKKRRRLRTHGFLARDLSLLMVETSSVDVDQKGRHVLTPSYPIRLKSPKGNPKFHIIPKKKPKKVVAKKKSK
jgi:hypothetical protein